VILTVNCIIYHRIVHCIKLHIVTQIIQSAWQAFVDDFNEEDLTSMSPVLERHQPLMTQSMSAAGQPVVVDNCRMSLSLYDQQASASLIGASLHGAWCVASAKLWLETVSCKCQDTCGRSTYCFRIWTLRKEVKVTLHTCTRVDLHTQYASHGFKLTLRPTALQ